MKAQKAGVQPEDRLVSIQDNDKQLPVQNPGEEIVISQKNYHEALTLVRAREGRGRGGGLERRVREREREREGVAVDIVPQFLAVTG